MWLCGAFAFRQASPPSRVYGGDVRPLAQDPKPLAKPSGQEARKLDDPRGRGRLPNFRRAVEGLTVAHFPALSKATTRTPPRPLAIPESPQFGLWAETAKKMNQNASADDRGSSTPALSFCGGRRAHHCAPARVRPDHSFAARRPCPVYVADCKAANAGGQSFHTWFPDSCSVSRPCWWSDHSCCGRGQPSFTPRALVATGARASRTGGR